MARTTTAITKLPARIRTKARAKTATRKTTKTAKRAPAAAERVEWDARCPGLGLRVRPSGTASWIVQRRIGGKLVKKTLGRADQIDRDTARAMAEELTGAAEAASVVVKEAPPTLAMFAERFLADCTHRWKASTWRRNAHDVRSMIVPGLGALRVDRVTQDDVVAWRTALGDRVSVGTRDRALAVLSGLMRHAEALGLRRRGRNPCKGLRKGRSGFEGRCLTTAEFARLGIALAEREADRPVLVALVRFIALTGCRRGEAVDLVWDRVQGERALLDDAKGGQRVLWLGAAARAVLAALPHTASPRVFPSLRGCRLDAALTAFWSELRAAADLGTVRVHDLRHSFGTVAVEIGESERAVQGLLGHRELTTTAGYVHLSDRLVTDAAARMGERLGDALAGERAKAERARQPKPAPDPERRAAKAEREKAVKALEPMARCFLTSSLTLSAFCAREGLDEATFQAAVRRVRKIARNADRRAA